MIAPRRDPWSEGTHDFAAAAERAVPPMYELRLYVTGMTERSGRAIGAARTLCDAHLPGRYRLEVIDLCRHPELASREQIVAAPTLVKILPLPARRLVGDLSQSDKVLRGLGLPARPVEQG